MKSLKSTFALAFVAAFTVAVVSGCKMSPGERAEKIASHVSSKLDLNDAQKAEFKKLTELGAADFKAMHEERKAIANEVEKQLVAEKADVTMIKKMVAAQNAKRQELSDKWIDRLAEFQAKLSPEQKQKALKSMQKFREKFESRFED